MYDIFEKLITDHKVKRQARRMTLRDRQNVALVAKSVPGKRGRDRGEREPVRPGLNQETPKR
jgi:hypothetical protein